MVAYSASLHCPLNYHSHVEADDYGHSLTPPRQICRAGVELCLASWCEAFCAAERSYPEQSPEWYDGVEIAVGWNGFSQIPVIDKGRANRHARGLFHFCDFGSNLVYDTFLDTGSPLDFHHALRTLRLQQQIDLVSNTLRTILAVWRCRIDQRIFKMQIRQQFCIMVCLLYRKNSCLHPYFHENAVIISYFAYLVQ